MQVKIIYQKLLKHLHAISNKLSDVLHTDLFIFFSDMVFDFSQPEFVMIVKVVSPKEYKYTCAFQFRVVFWVLLLRKLFLLPFCCHHALPKMQI
jgi:hypothetical protein